MDDHQVTELIHLARSSPREAIARAEELLVAAGEDAADGSRLQRILCEATRLVRPIGESIDWGRRAVALATEAGSDELRREASLTLSGSLHLSGDVAGALAAVADAAAGATGVFAAKTDFQRATILAREGRHRDALAGYAAALPVFVANDETRFVALCHQNGGNVKLETGDVRGALVAFGQARELFAQLQLRVPVAMMEHNLGRAHGYAGRVADAMAHLDAAERQLDELTDGSWEIKASKCEILLQAGLHADALALAERAEVELGKAGFEVERAEALLWSAVATLELGDPDVGLGLAERAAELFRGQGREPWALQCEALALRCGLAAGQEPAAEDARRLAETLGTAGQALGAAWAWGAVAVTDPEVALDGLSSLGLGPAELPIELRLARSHIEAMAHEKAGDRSRALAVTRSALADGHQHRSMLGSSDVIAGASAQLARLCELGLSMRLDQGRPDAVVRWVERCRSATTRPLPPADRSTEVEALTAELRVVQLEARTAGPEAVVSLLRRQARIQHRLRVADRVTRRSVGSTSTTLPRDLGRAYAGRSVVQYFESGGRLHAAVVDGKRSRLVALADAADAAARFARLVKAADRFAAGPGERARARLERAAAAVADDLLPPTCEGPTTIAPLARDLSVPWALLPPLSQRAVTVAPSLFTIEPAARQGVAVVLGPGLATGEAEVEALAATYRANGHDVTVLRGAAATTEATLGLLGQVEVAHLASHGHRSSGDARFGGIQLHDGDLTTFDLEGLEQAPATVVFSGCDAGILQPLPGGEAVGLAGALFQRGSTAVVAATCPLPDVAATGAFFVDLHRRLAAGVAPGDALAAARLAQPDPDDAAVAGLVSCFRLG